MCTVIATAEDALTARLLQSTIHTLELFGVYLGKELGLYAALTSHGPLTPAGLAREAGIARRYAREWLEQQAVAGVLTSSHCRPLRMNGDTACRTSTSTCW
jgi:hypothetical protein